MNAIRLRATEFRDYIIIANKTAICNGFKDSGRCNQNSYLQFLDTHNGIRCRVSDYAIPPDLPLFVPPGSTKPTLDNSMKSSKSVSGQEVLDIANSYSRGIRLSRLFELISERFGPHARFCVGCHIGVDFDCLMVYLESHGILSIYDGVVFTSFPLARAM